MNIVNMAVTQPAAERAGSRALIATAESVWVSRPDQRDGMDQVHHSRGPSANCVERRYRDTAAAAAVAAVGYAGWRRRDLAA